MTERLITVCDACFTASCWHGEFMCQRAQWAGVVEKTEAELQALDLEHPEHYSREKVAQVCGETACSRK